MKKLSEIMKGKKRYIIAAVAGASAVAASLGAPIPAWVQTVIALTIGQ